jgi:hypothetical protein
MKRCPTDQGGCGQLVDMLFDSGVCQKCDAMINRGTAAAGGVPRRRRAAAPEPPEPGENDHPETKPCGKYVKGPERGICATCQATRAAHLSAPKAERKTRQPAAGKNGASDKELLEKLRDGYSRALADAEHQVAYLRVKVEAANEILSELQRAH